MAGTSLIMLLDDIATTLDDVALMAKVAAKKTTGVLGDDLALNAEQVVGVAAERELPVVWAVAKGSFRNKLILVPLALLINAIAPWLVTPLLMLGGAYLCFEGFEKLAHKFLHSQDEEQDHHRALQQALTDPKLDMLAFEKDKIKGAIRTDFILSAEIIVITLGTVVGASFIKQLIVLSGIAVVMTAGVYGLVAGIVKLDDGGLYLLKRKGDGLLRRLQRKFGAVLFAAAPVLMKFLSVVGTIAMFMVGGGILSHGVPFIHHAIEQNTAGLTDIPAIGGLLHSIVPSLLDSGLGVLAGGIVLAIVKLAEAGKKLWRPAA